MSKDARTLSALHALPGKWRTKGESVSWDHEKHIQRHETLRECATELEAALRSEEHQEDDKCDVCGGPRSTAAKDHRDPRGHQWTHRLTFVSDGPGRDEDAALALAYEREGWVQSRRGKVIRDLDERCAATNSAIAALEARLRGKP